MKGKASSVAQPIAGADGNRVDLQHGRTPGNHENPMAGSAGWASRLPGHRGLARIACTMVQPLLTRTVRKIARNHTSLFARLGPYREADFLIDPVELPFALHLRPDPDNLTFCAVPRDAAPPVTATIQGPFMLLLQLIDADEDGDAAFFSRALTITGDTEAVVRLRNALDDVDGSIAEETAGLFGRPGQAILKRLRRSYHTENTGI
ncbi:ubiquinone anaerobic biosynthesis accessory factor UbiT [Paracoccus xiamenensis]|uniref:ubiquinone anaerobic biosynthesis accessory factor UbiT n=1 Tax=Paracoccus xiamenensis TaxID=2714901 RepID=UPI001F1CF68F|nr:SCP2 sterol-binding domain-containing protein [Paracoccus xiamenensis]